MTVAYVICSDHSDKNYHTNLSCPYIRDKTLNDRDRDILDAHGWTECKWCSGELQYPREHRKSLVSMINDGDVQPEESKSDSWKELYDRP